MFVPADEIRLLEIERMTQALEAARGSQTRGGADRPAATDVFHQDSSVQPSQVTLPGSGPGVGALCLVDVDEPARHVSVLNDVPSRCASTIRTTASAM
jgi:hypothetical protein